MRVFISWCLAAWGFQAVDSKNRSVRAENTDFEGSWALAISYEALGPGQLVVTNPDLLAARHAEHADYELIAALLGYPGQAIRARVLGEAANRGPVRFLLRHDESTGDVGVVVYWDANPESVTFQARPRSAALAHVSRAFRSSPPREHY